MSVKLISPTELLGKYCLLSDCPNYGLGSSTLADYSGGLILFDSEEEAKSYYETEANFNGPHEVYQIADDTILIVSEWGTAHSTRLYELDAAYMQAHNITLSDEPLVANHNEPIATQLFKAEMAIFEAEKLLDRGFNDDEPAEIDMSEVTPGNTEQVYTDQPIPKREA